MRKIKGKLPGKLKAKIWRELAGFDPLAGGKFNFDGTVERIAQVYNVKPEDVENELTVDELFPVFLDCVGYVNSQVLKKLEMLPNAESGQKK